MCNKHITLSLSSKLTRATAALQHWQAAYRIAESDIPGMVPQMQEINSPQNSSVTWSKP
jgi:hypothetical protein